jgi:hypothetical protein
MDEAFVPFSRVVERITAVGAQWTDAEAGVHTYVTACEIDAPVELDVTRDADGRLRIGTTPPLYPLRTSITPSFHRLRVTAALSEEPDGRV